MKLSIKIALAALLLSGTATPTFAGPTTIITTDNEFEAEDRDVSGFNGIALSGSFDYYITQGSRESVKVEASAELLSKIVTEVKNGVLRVYTKDTKWNLFNNQKVVIRITAKDLNSIELSGSGDVFFKGGISTNNLRVNLSGSGDITGKVSVSSTLDCSVAGSGDVNLGGKTKNLHVRVVGSGDFSGHGLVAANASVKVVGSGDAEVHASETLNASVSGSGSVHYSGNPKNINKSVAGSGDVSGH